MTQSSVEKTKNKISGREDQQHDIHFWMKK